MHSFTVNYDTFSNEDKVAVVVPVTSIDETCSEAMLALSFSTLLVKCLMKTGKVSTMVNGWQYFWWMSIRECYNYLVQFFTGRYQSYSFSVKFAFNFVHKF